MQIGILFERWPKLLHNVTFDPIGHANAPRASLFLHLTNVIVYDAYDACIGMLIHDNAWGGCFESIWRQAGYYVPIQLRYIVDYVFVLLSSSVPARSGTQSRSTDGSRPMKKQNFNFKILHGIFLR